jgi:cytochrome P450
LQSFGEEFGKPDTVYREAWDAKKRILKDLEGRISSAIDAYKASDLDCTVVKSLFEAIEGRGEPLDVEHVTAQFAQDIPFLVLSGTGTTAFASASVVMYLNQYPEWLQHAYEEQKRIIEKHGSQMSAKVRFLFLRAIQNDETL